VRCAIGTLLLRVPFSQDSQALMITKSSKSELILGSHLLDGLQLSAQKDMSRRWSSPQNMRSSPKKPSPRMELLTQKSLLETHGSREYLSTFFWPETNDFIQH